MRDRTIIPTNLLDWPRCSTLLPDQKLIIHWLWACPYFSCAGAGLLPINAAAATLGLDAQALAGGLKTLVEAQLIEIDQQTGEVAICDWFRFHTFKSPMAKSSLAAAIKKIESETIKNSILLKINDLLTNTNTNFNSNSNSNSNTNTNTNITPTNHEPITVNHEPVTMYAESHTATAHTDPHLAGNICAAIHNAGVMMVNPAYVGLLQLISDGVVDLAVYVNYTNMAISIKKPYFKYILKMISTALKDGDLSRAVVTAGGATVSLNKTEVRILGEEKAAQNAAAQTFMVDELTGKML